MLEWINHVILVLTDPALGWLLRLPSDLMLFIVAVGTGAVLTFVRLWTTDQDLLGRCRSDKRRLKELLRESKKRRDKEAIRRLRTTVGQIAMKAMKAEWKPLLAAIIPIALLGTWAFQRIAYHPTKAGEPAEIVAYFPLSASGGIAHILPEDNVTAKNGWVQAITAQQHVTPDGEATWEIEAAAKETPYHLKIRYRGRAYDRTLLVGQRTYEPPLEFYDDDQLICTEVKLRPVRLFGIVPGIPLLYLQPWLVAYFVIAIPSVSLLKRVFQIL